MADMFKLQIITPDKIFYQGDASMVELTTSEGDIGIYANHIPMTAIIAPGILKIHEEGELKKASLISGFIEVLQDRVTIMAEVAEWPDEIDTKRAEEARIRAERRICDHMKGTDIARAELALKRALVRLEATAR